MYYFNKIVNTKLFPRCYGNRQSLAATQRSRLAMAFESKETAKQRSASTGSKKRSPVGKLSNVTWDKERMKEEVESYPDDTKVNWSDMARRYSIRNTKGEIAKNGGQVAQEWLKSVGVNVSRFKRPCEQTGERIRRKKLRGAGGEITVATSQTISSVKEEMKKKVMSGEYTVGQHIAPRKVSYFRL